MSWSGGNQALDMLPSQREVEEMLEEAHAPYTVKHIPANAVLFWEAQPCSCHFYLAEGRIELYKVDGSYRKRSIDFYGPGAFFGYQFLRTSKLPMTTARACTDSRVLVIPEESYFAALHGCPRFADTTVRNLFGLLAMQTNEVINSSFYAASQRAALLLLSLARDETGRNPGEPGPALPYGNADIAEMLGMSRNSVTAALSRLQEQGAVEKERGLIRIVNRGKLEEIANLSTPR